MESHRFTLHHLSGSGIALVAAQAGKFRLGWLDLIFISHDNQRRAPVLEVLFEFLIVVIAETEIPSFFRNYIAPVLR